MNTIMFMPMNGRRLHRRWADDLVRGSLNLLYQSRIFKKNPNLLTVKEKFDLPLQGLTVEETCARLQRSQTNRNS